MAAFDRRSFLYALGAGSLAPAAGLAAAAPALATSYDRLDHALVLSGGGAKGAYEAGVIDTLARGIPDGRPMEPYDGVAGTSIGCVNGWFVATGQYTAMRSLWMNVANEHVFRLKPQYEKIKDPSAGVLNRAYEVVDLVLGVRRDVQGLCQTEPALGWIQKYVDPERPTLIPFAWAVTNLTTQQSEYFYRLPADVSATQARAALDAFKQTLDPGTVVREATNDILHKAIFASACLPIVFDPVDLPAPDGNGTNQYCDGGVAANIPLDFARTVARNVHVILLSPQSAPQHYKDAAEIGWTAYDIIQRHILESAMRVAFYESEIKRAIREIPGLPKIARDIPDVEMAFIRPQETLPVETTTFNNGEKIAEAYAMGMRDAAAGFKPYRS